MEKVMKLTPESLEFRVVSLLLFLLFLLQRLHLQYYLLTLFIYPCQHHITLLLDSFDLIFKLVESMMKLLLGHGLCCFSSLHFLESFLNFRL